jgi:8-oxo-dGTP pyrophosphatase MutT (NUDIX family)
VPGEHLPCCGREPRRLTLRTMIDDPRLQLLRRAFEQRSALTLGRKQETIEAAVALLLRPRSTVELLLIQRAEHPSDPWSGHMALPGGRRDPGDPDLLHTALREVREETGIKAQRDAQLIGALDEVQARSRRQPPVLVTPYAVAAARAAAARPGRRAAGGGGGGA